MSLLQTRNNIKKMKDVEDGVPDEVIEEGSIKEQCDKYDRVSQKSIRRYSKNVRRIMKQIHIKMLNQRWSISDLIRPGKNCEERKTYEKKSLTKSIKTAGTTTTSYQKTRTNTKT